MSDIHVLHVWSPTCGPCNVIKPAIAQLKEEFEEYNIDWISINIKDDPKGYTQRFQVNVVPTMIVFKGQTEVGRYAGSNIAIIYQLIRKVIAA